MHDPTDMREIFGFRRSRLTVLGDVQLIRGCKRLAAVNGKDDVHARAERRTVEVHQFLGDRVGHDDVVGNLVTRIGERDRVVNRFTGKDLLGRYEAFLFLARIVQEHLFLLHSRLHIDVALRRSREGWETIRLSGSIPEQYWSPTEAPGTGERDSVAEEVEHIYEELTWRNG